MALEANSSPLPVLALPNLVSLTVKNAADLAILTEKAADLVAPPEPLLAVNEESNEMLDLLHSHIPDILSYGCKRMLSRCLLEAQASSWLTALSMLKNTGNARSKRQIRALGVTKFEREPKSYKKAIESVN